MSLDKSRIPELSDSSRYFIPKKQRKSMDDPFVERIARTGTTKMEKVSGGMVETRRQKASEGQKAKFRNLPWLRIERVVERKGMGTEVWQVNLLR